MARHLIARDLETDGPGPLLGGAGEDRYYSTRLRHLLRVDLEERSARALWLAVRRHRSHLERVLGRSVGQRVALLDYVENVSPGLIEPRIIEAGELALIERQALLDPLTGLYNRAYFDATIARETERCKRDGTPAALLMLDLDRFKAVNDREGHQRGDAVLRTVSELMRAQLRAADIPCRLGGDELAAVLAGADRVEARRVAERIRASAAAAFAGDSVPVTTSVGVALLLVDPPSELDAYARADRALYAAKRAGGDRVMEDSADGTPPHLKPAA